MSARLQPGAVVPAVAEATAFTPVPEAQRRDGQPATRFVDLDETDGRAIGVWEMSPGVMTDVEVDEVFVVVAGDATVEFVDPALPSIQLRPGDVVRLEAGMNTVWTVRETLRKVYIAP